MKSVVSRVSLRAQPEELHNSLAHAGGCMGCQSLREASAPTLLEQSCGILRMVMVTLRRVAPCLAFSVYKPINAGRKVIWRLADQPGAYYIKIDDDAPGLAIPCCKL